MNVKKTFALVCATASSLAGAPICAADTVYDLEYETADGWVQVESSGGSLVTAMNGVKDNGTIRLLRDITVNVSSQPDPIYIYRTVTLDGCNRTVSLDSEFYVHVAGDVAVLTFKNLELTSTTDKSAHLAVLEQRGKVVLDNVYFHDYATSSQIFHLRSGTLQLANGSRIENVSGDRLFSFEQDDGDAAMCGDTGYTNVVEISDSVLSGLGGMRAAAMLYQGQWYPAVFRMSNSSLTGCSIAYGIELNDRLGSFRTDDGGYYAPEFYLEDGSAITNNSFTAAAIEISPTGTACKVEFAGDLRVFGNGNDVVFANRFDTLAIEDGVTGDIRVTSPSGFGEQFAVDGGASDLSAFRLTGDDTSFAVARDGAVVWSSSAAFYVDGIPYSNFAEAERAKRAEGRYIFKSGDDYVSKTISEKSAEDTRYVTVGGDVMTESVAAETWAYRVSDATTNSWTGCTDVAAVATAAVGRNGCVIELLKDVEPSGALTLSNCDNVTICGAGHVWRFTNLPATTRAIQHDFQRTILTDIVFDGCWDSPRRADAIVFAQGGGTAEIVLDSGTVVSNFWFTDVNANLPAPFFIGGNSGAAVVRMKDGALIENCTMITGWDIFMYNEASGTGQGVSCYLEGGIIRGCRARTVFQTSNTGKDLRLSGTVITNNTFSAAAAVQTDGCPVKVSGRPVIRDNVLEAGGTAGVKVVDVDNFIQDGDILEGAEVPLMLDQNPVRGGQFGVWQSGAGASAFYPVGKSKTDWSGCALDGKLVWKDRGFILVFR